MSKQTAQDLFDFLKASTALVDKIYYLKFRWLDEREYEDFKDYKKGVEELFKNSAYEVVSVSKTFNIELKEFNSADILTMKCGVNGYKIFFKTAKAA